MRDLTIGVIGTGRIGAAVIDRLRGFGGRILAYDRSPKAAADYVPLDELLRVSDIVTLQETAKAVYRALGCRGISRVDMFLKEDGTVVLNEVNTLPGMTSYSRYPRMMAAAGLPLAEVIDRIVSLALTGKVGER
jgi:D-alanine-D-alanine ligase-like ATP-grasp enzyme